MDCSRYEANRRHEPSLYLKPSPRQTNDCRILLVPFLFPSCSFNQQRIVLSTVRESRSVCWYWDANKQAVGFPNTALKTERTSVTDD